VQAVAPCLFGDIVEVRNRDVPGIAYDENHSESAIAEKVLSLWRKDEMQGYETASADSIQSSHEQLMLHAPTDAQARVLDARNESEASGQQVSARLGYAIGDYARPRMVGTLAVHKQAANPD
jgi:hypothetical protein